MYRQRKKLRKLLENENCNAKRRDQETPAQYSTQTVMDNFEKLALLMPKDSSGATCDTFVSVEQIVDVSYPYFI